MQINVTGQGSFRRYHPASLALAFVARSRSPRSEPRVAAHAAPACMPGCLLLSGVFEGPLTGVELFAACDIPDLRQYGVTAYPKGASSGNNYTFGDGSLRVGQFVYLSRNDGFREFFGIAPTVAPLLAGNETALGTKGDDVFEVLFNGTVIDTFGEIGVDGTNMSWDFMDGWAYRSSATGPDGTTFALASWTFGNGAWKRLVDGSWNYFATNAAADNPMPIGQYSLAPLPPMLPMPRSPPCVPSPSTPPPSPPPPSPASPPTPLSPLSTPSPPAAPPATARSVFLGIGYCRDATGDNPWGLAGSCRDSVQKCGQACEARANCAGFAFASPDTLPAHMHDGHLNGCEPGSGSCALYIGQAVATQASGDVGYVAHRLDPTPPWPPLPPPPPRTPPALAQCDVAVLAQEYSVSDTQQCSGNHFGVCSSGACSCGQCMESCTNAVNGWGNPIVCMGWHPQVKRPPEPSLCAGCAQWCHRVG